MRGLPNTLGTGFDVTGMLGVLRLVVAPRGAVDLADSLARLKRTNFCYRQEIMDELLKQQEGG
jgi:hypothetical protein